MKQTINQKIAEIFREIASLLEIRETSFRSRAYQKAAMVLEGLQENVQEVYQAQGLKGLRNLKGIGKSMAKKIEEFIQKGQLKYLQELREETAIRQVITHYFESKGLSLGELKKSAKKRKIVYSRYTRPAKQLIELSGSVENAKKAIDKVAKWANSRDLDYAIETVFKKWLELDRLKPKEIVKKPFYEGKPMVFSQTKKKWYVIDDTGEWLEFADKESKIEWRIVK